jgi:lipopolysaccharide/colanic/teichoic acid biosynthesis glycosyltransferase
MAQETQSIYSKNSIQSRYDTSGYAIPRTGQQSWADGAAPAVTPDLALRMRFMVSELLGLLFILATTLYIFAMPSHLSRPGQILVMGKAALKRTIDLVGATVAVIVTLPVMAAVAIAIKIDSRGPVFYMQERVGRDRRKRERRYHQKVDVSCRRSSDRRQENRMGKPFTLIKFRTMVQDAEKASGPVWAAKNDPRVTRLGRFLRRTRLDEIPQFFNVLKGDMSLVGPRPERPHFVQQLSSKIDGYADRLSVKPGITGLAQIENGYDSSLDSVQQKVKSDLEYIDKMSLWTDIKILARTVIVVFTGRGAR